MEVILDETTSNFLAYNHQLPQITSNFLMVAMVAMVIKVAMVIMVRTGQDRTKLTFKLDFPGNL